TGKAVKGGIKVTRELADAAKKAVPEMMEGLRNGLGPQVAIAGIGNTAGSGLAALGKGLQSPTQKTAEALYWMGVGGEGLGGVNDKLTNPKMGDPAKPAEVKGKDAEGTSQAPNIDLDRIGTGAVGDFQNVKDVNDLISRIPADAKQIPWREVPGGAKEGVKFRWVDEAGKTWDVRAHSIDPSAPPGSNAANGWIYRVEVKQVNPKWKWTMDSNGNFHKENVLRENSPHYDESIANETHIPFTP
ncbi:polymorphic toxin type 30 domain-containing protein, partial [Paenibacillus sp. CN-4]|uniref:polymorphic toxin type 30 domain-containing protein n=1 Tax=Paenibacillus nanchangensis TaxID=3348343 RepID=UPI00397AE55A